tara:strand:+ start:652 stop:1197 length:546 start_codon:yes stop_codon:yes gene_type:complete
MNDLQKNIYKVIVSIIETNGILEKFEDKENYGEKKIIDNSSIRYGILNYVAKYSLANNSYFITSKCYEHLNNIGLMKKGKLLRGSKGSKNRFTFEHPVPSNVIADEIIKNIGDRNKIMKLLRETDLVTVITYEENDMINECGFTNEMPENSFAQMDMFARYKISGVEVPSRKIEVYGAIAR